MRGRTNHGGQGMVEYVLIVGLIGIFVMALAMYLLPPIRNIYRDALTTETLGQVQASMSAGLYQPEAPPPVPE